MKIIEKEFNVETNMESIIERDETNAEKKIREAKIKEHEVEQKKLETKVAEKQAIADRLGLTLDELKLLLG